MGFWCFADGYLGNIIQLLWTTFATAHLERRDCSFVAVGVAG